MSEEKYVNSGILHTNPNRKTDKHPPYTGFANVRCPQCDALSKFWVSGFLNDVRQGSKIPGKKYFGLRFRCQEQQQRPAPAQTTSGSEPESTYEGDAPF